MLRLRAPLSPNHRTVARLEHKLNRQQLIARVAADIIAERGIESATFREIAARSGVSKGVVEHHFSDKNDIVRKTLEWVNQRALKREQRATAKKQGLAAIEARLRCLLPVKPELVREWKIRVHYWSMAFAQQDDQLGMSLRITGARERFLEDLKHAIAAGEIPAEVDPAIATNMLLHLLAGVSCNMLVDPGYYDKGYQLALVRRVMEQLRSGRL